MSIALLIYNQLRASGCSHAGALGLMGNWQAESGLEPSRLQNDFSPQRTLSKAYTADVAAGRISRTQFARDQKGYGLAQWTYFNFSTGEGRKLNLYDYWKQSGKALDDPAMQVSFALHELQTESQYAGLWKTLKTTDDLFTAVDKVCRLYEQPYYLNIDTRFRYAKELEVDLEQATGSGRHGDGSLSHECETGNCPLSEAADAAAPSPYEERYYPYRTIDLTMSGADVTVLQAILAARGYFSGTLNGVFGSELDTAVRQFQKDHNLVIDGVVGPNTWKEILK